MLYMSRDKQLFKHTEHSRAQL